MNYAPYAKISLHREVIKNCSIHEYHNFTFRIKSRLSCNMDLHFYPMDNQSCSMVLESCRYPSFCWTIFIILVLAEYDDMVCSSFHLSCSMSVFFVNGHFLPISDFCSEAV